jgi:hypothetical protein
MITESPLYGTFTIINSILLGIRLFSNHEKISPITQRLRIPASALFSSFSITVFFTGYDPVYITAIIMTLVSMLQLYLLYLNTDQNTGTGLKPLSL